MGVVILLDATALGNRMQPPLPASIPASAATLTDFSVRPFLLADQLGTTMSLSSPRGRLVVLTFLDTNCPDICPVTPGRFGIAGRRLGA